MNQTKTNTIDAYSSLFAKSPDVVNVHQMAKMLNIGLSLAYALVKNGHIASRKIGREYKITKLSLIQFLLNTQ